ncbi:SRPBCC family protein [Flagellimonas halotolerans]|uniref:SRPBCC family protein n=1 Tax=Flagellimonas halotolerans TaxID=3112164 RepID=A0ABU6IU90_9FLAO|nr:MULTISPECIES: SRPBCC family protein [unclassified Allomuricauda]MEC3966881.1 SRPBCC family protein [Muricauda sp. SYSU M86414]MEC4266713.1 SRPBCC family protein [Muricauda sp. SYSU M84420]
METISVASSIFVPVKKVWNYYTTPEHIIKWNFADPSWHCPKAENDLRVGGSYLARMEAKDGSFGFDFEAVYDDIIKEKKISYTMGDGRKATILFDGNDKVTKVTITFDAESNNSLEMQKNGWQAILNNFASYTEAN